MSERNTPDERAFREEVDIRSLTGAGRALRLVADDAARAAVALRLDVPAVSKLIGAFEVRREAAVVIVTGAIDAQLTRECVVSLQPVEETVCEQFELRFAADPRPEESVVEIDVLIDEPEPLTGDALDLAEILVQQLSLAIDPYPRRGDASALAQEFGPRDAPSPFAGLRGAIAAGPDEE